MLRPATKSNPALTKTAIPGVAQPRFPVWRVAALLALVTIAAYWPATTHDFVNYDDPNYVTANPQVQGGLTWEGVKWACLNPVCCNWHPLTVWSHMAVCRICGLNPWGHHLTNVLLHALNAGLLFLLLRQLTGATWRSLLVAALFALHPLHVESVAWVAERKDVLSGFFGLLALMAYARYAQGRMPNAVCRRQKPEIGNPKSEIRSPKESRYPKPESTAQSAATGSMFDVQCSTLDVRPASPWSCGVRCFWYWTAAVLFACGLMSKPTLVTLPFVMLLLDYWPLGRIKHAERRTQNERAGDTSTLRSPPSAVLLRRTGATEDGHHATRNAQSPTRLTPQSQIANPKLQIPLPLLVEKLPFFALSTAVSVATFIVQKQGGAVKSAADFSLGARAGNALVSYCHYLGKLFWPMELAVFYPHPGNWPLGKVLLAGAVLLGISLLVWGQRRRAPFLLVGWLWFVGMLVPMIGLVQSGGWAMADRHTYLPTLGVLILTVWGASELVQGKAAVSGQRSAVSGQKSEVGDTSTLRSPPSAVLLRRTGATEDGHHAPLNTQHVSRTRVQSQIANRKSQIFLWVAGGVAIILCLALMRQQLGHWKNSETIFVHALKVTENNYVAHINLGNALDEQGRIDEAITQFQETIRLIPDYAMPHYSLGVDLSKQGRMDEAIFQFQECIRLKPDYVAHNSLGYALQEKGQTDEAIRQFQEAIRLNPNYPMAHYNLGLARLREGRADEAIHQFQEAIRLRPDDADARNNLGYLLLKNGHLDEAVTHFQEAIRLNPNHAPAHNNLGLAFAGHGEANAAIQQFQEAIRLKPDFAEARRNLRNALLKKGQTDAGPRQ